MTVINESGDSFATDAQWDAGDLGCGDLVLALRSRLNAMPGQVLLVTARDAGAREDIPAFCRMTGHQLLNADTASARYRIRARMPK
jgi:tRNA 2-thiouridine synthesizing protein A